MPTRFSGGRKHRAHRGVVLHPFEQNVWGFVEFQCEMLTSRTRVDFALTFLCYCLLYTAAVLNSSLLISFNFALLILEKGRQSRGEELGGSTQVGCSVELPLSPTECHKRSGVAHYLIFKTYFELDLKEFYQLSLDFQKLPFWFDVYHQI